MSMLPKEHGAYGQLAFPLVTAMAVTDVTAPAVLTVVAAAGGFLAHEPLLVLLGRRGARARRETVSHAIWWLALTGGVGVTAGAAALWLAPDAVRWSLLLPLAPAAVLIVALWRDREKTGLGEIAAAMTFSLAAVPVCLLGGTSPSVAFSVGIAFAAIFSASTLGVRVVILRVRGGGNPRQVRVVRRALVTLTACVVLALVTTALVELLPWATLLAVAPGLVLAVALALRPPAPTRLRTVGWTLVSASSAAALILIMMLASIP